MHRPDQPTVVAMGVIAVGEHVLARAVLEALLTPDFRFHREPKVFGRQCGFSFQMCVRVYVFVKATHLVLEALSLLLKHPRWVSCRLCNQATNKWVLNSRVFFGTQTKLRYDNVLAGHLQHLRRLVSHSLHFFHRDHYLRLHDNT